MVAIFDQHWVEYHNMRQTETEVNVVSKLLNKRKFESQHQDAGSFVILGSVCQWQKGAAVEKHFSTICAQ